MAFEKLAYNYNFTHFKRNRKENTTKIYNWTIKLGTSFRNIDLLVPTSSDLR